jgi:uncharacterized protein (DUF4415 family)
MPVKRSATRAKSRRLVRDKDGWLKDSRTGALIGPDPEMERELTDAELERAWVFEGERVIKRGAGKNPRGRPPKAPEDRKRMVTVRLEPAVIDYYKAGGPGWQTRINATLERHVRASRKGGEGSVKAKPAAHVSKKSAHAHVARKLTTRHGARKRVPKK